MMRAAHANSRSTAELIAGRFRGRPAAKFVAVIAAGVLIRLLMLLVVSPSMGGDGAYYLHAAHSGPDFYRPPLYALFLVPFANSPGLAFAAQSALTIVAACLCLRLTGALWAALLIALCPFLVVYEYMILSEALLIALLLIVWLLLDRGHALWAGLCVGLAMLTNDVFVLLPLFAVPFGILLGRGRQFAVMAAAAYLVAAPWAASNLATHGRFALSQGRMGFNLWVGTWERDGRWMDRGVRIETMPATAFRSDQEKFALATAMANNDDAEFKRIAIDRVASDPAGTAVTWATRYWRMWLGTRTDQAQLRLAPGTLPWAAFKAGMWGLNLIFLAAGLIGLAVSRRWIYAIPLLYIAAIYVPFHNTEPRYSLPALAILLIPLGLALPSMFRGFHLRRTSIPSGRQPPAPN